MNTPRGGTARKALLAVAVDLFRSHGFSRTSLDTVCRTAGVTKGAFFHHFASKDALVKACLERWEAQAKLKDASAPWRALDDPVARLAGCLDATIAALSDPDEPGSCLAGAAAQESGGQPSVLREGARAYFSGTVRRLERLVREAAGTTGADVDARSLAQTWTAAVQGALVLRQAEDDPEVVATCLGHARAYLLGRLLPDGTC